MWHKFTKLQLRSTFKFLVKSFERSFSDTIASASPSQTLHTSKLSIDKFHSLIKSVRTEKLIELILAEYDYELKTTGLVPSTLDLSDMKQIMSYHKLIKAGHQWKDHSCFQRLYYLQLLNDNEKIYEKMKHEFVESLFLPFVPRQRHQSSKHRVAALFGPRLVFDLSFDEHMLNDECKNLVEQLKRIYMFNRSQREPFDLHFCNVDPKDRSYSFFPKQFNDLDDPEFYVTITEKSYLDVFPKEKLRYLSPHADEVMSEFDYDCVYIIGGIVDRARVVPLSNVKAVKEGVRTVRLPLDELLKENKFKAHVQSLDDVFRVMHDIKGGMLNWKKTLKTRIPKSKLKTSHEIAYDELSKEAPELIAHFQTTLSLANN